VWVTPPPLPVIVNGKVPGDAAEVATTLRVEENEDVPDVGLNVPDTPAGAPERVRATFWGGPETKFTVTVKLVLPPGATACWLGEADMEKSKGIGEVTVKLMLPTLLLGSGSPAVETDQVSVCVPGVAIHGVCALTVAGTPAGPG
jgi:hypothetical protein